MKKFIVIIILQVSFCTTVISQAAGKLKLWYNHPAANWLEAMPIGNGSLGAMIFGGVNQEHIQFNQESLVTGTTQTVGSYQPFGDIFIDFPDFKTKDYLRELDISSAIQKV